MYSFSLVNFLIWFSSLEEETAKSYPSSPVDDEGRKAEERSIVGKDSEKKKKKKRADKRCARERMLDSDDLLFVSRREVKQKGRNSLPSNEEEFEGKAVPLEKYKC